MKPFKRLLARVRNFTTKHRGDERLREEMEEHLALQTEENIRVGMTLAEARRQARLQFGAIEAIRENYHAEKGLPLLENLLHDTRFALRILCKSPGFTVLAVLTLALGIGATTAIFSVVNGVVLKPLPYPDPERLVDVRLKLPDVNQGNWGLSRADFFIFREQSTTFQDVGLYTIGLNSQGEAVNVTGIGQPEHVPAQSVTASVLPILGVTPQLGRVFAWADDQPDSPDTVVLNYGYWRSKFGGDKSVLGRAIDVDGRPRTIIGVLPQRFSFLDKTNLAMLLPMKLDRVDTHLGDYNSGAIARLRPGVTLAQANAYIARMIPIVLRSFPPPPCCAVKDFENLRLQSNLLPLKQEVVGNVDKVLWVLMGGIGLVLLIACANVANLLLLRAEGRQREFAIRAALGSTRGRIAAGLLAESLILAAFGGVLGLGLAYGALKALVAMALTGLPRLHEIGIDGRVVLFALAVSLAASLLFGSVPVFKYAGAGIGIRLREGGRSMSESRERRRSRGLLVIVQVALALVLLVSSGLMIRTFRALTRVNPGFEAPSEVLTFRVYIPETQVKDPARVFRIEQAISQTIATLPGVSSAGVSADLPMDGGGDLDGVFVKDRIYASSETPLYRYDYVAPGFLKTLGTPLVAGRDFTWSEIYSKVPVAMVSEKFARDFWRDPSSAIGKQIGGGPKNPWREIVGVVGDVRQDGVDKEAPASVYLPVLASFFGGDYVSRDVAFAIRSPRAASAGMMSEVQRAVWSVDSGLPLSEVYTMDYYYTKSMARTSFMLVMLSLAAGMALLLGIVGLYGVIAYSVSQRTHELGIRMALGAQKRDVLKLVLTQGMRLTLIGVGAGLAGAFALTHFLSSLLYGVKAYDPLTFATVALLLIVVACFAGYIPARRAAKVDPMVALRYE
jgi:predicted permease